MLIITLAVEGQGQDPQAVKEAVAMDLEKYGDVRVLSVVEKFPQQMRIET